MLRPRGNWRTPWRKPWGYPLQDWTPAQLFAGGAEGLWYDLADPLSVFSDSAGTIPDTIDAGIGRLADKSGRGHYASQATVSKQPIWRRPVGYYYSQFDGVDDTWLVNNPAPLRTNAAVSVFVAARKLADDRDMVRCGTVADQLYSIATIAGGRWGAGYHDGVAFRAVIVPFGTWPADTDAVLGFVREADGLTYTLRHNGVTVSTQTAISAPVAVASQTIAIGSASSGRFFAGNLGGAVIVPRALSLPEVERVERYLAARFGVAL